MSQNVPVSALTAQVNIIENAFEEIVDLTGSIEPNMILVDTVDVHKCAPIVIDGDPGPRLANGCIPPLHTLARPVKVEDLLETLEKLKKWIHDIREVIEDLDQNIVLPGRTFQP